jgi:hypothetical protein
MMTIILTISVRPGKTRTHPGTWRRIDGQRTKTILRGQDLPAIRVAERRRKPLRVWTCAVAESWVVRVFPAVAIGRLWAGTRFRDSSLLAPIDLIDLTRAGREIYEIYGSEVRSTAPA